jgi:hypothetical protein
MRELKLHIFVAAFCVFVCVVSAFAEWKPWQASGDNGTQANLSSTGESAPWEGASYGSGCVGSDCLTILAVRRGTRCNSATSIEVDIRNDSDQYLRGFVIFNTPGHKTYAPTDVMSPGQVERGTQFACNANSSSVEVLANIGPSPDSVRYPQHPNN